MFLVSSVWGARGPGFKSRRPDQPFQSVAYDFTFRRKRGVDDFVDVPIPEGLTPLADDKNVKGILVSQGTVHCRETRSGAAWDCWLLSLGSIPFLSKHSDCDCVAAERTDPAFLIELEIKGSFKCRSQFSLSVAKTGIAEDGTLRTSRRGSPRVCRPD